ncbi:MAG TPA: hypothetical protein VE666_09395 [Mycobacterium sp.]|nr:hypothetical protein [Mycobacterium sp.]
MRTGRFRHPRRERLFASGELADIDTLLPRMLAQAAAGDAILGLPPMITAWASVPAN